MRIIAIIGIKLTVYMTRLHFDEFVEFLRIDLVSVQTGQKLHRFRNLEAKLHRPIRVCGAKFKNNKNRNNKKNSRWKMVCPSVNGPIRGAKRNFRNKMVRPQGRNWRALRAFPGRPWHRTQDSVGHKTDDKRGKQKEKKRVGKGKNL